MARMVINLRLLRPWLVLLLAGPLLAQSTEPPPNDPLGRATPQDAVYQFLEACHARQYNKAAHFLDLRQMPTGDREKTGPELARQLEDLLDDTPFDIATLSKSPLGDLDDGLIPSREHLLSFQVDGQSLGWSLITSN
jgi:MscS family membrane protein